MVVEGEDVAVPLQEGPDVRPDVSVPFSRLYWVNVGSYGFQGPNPSTLVHKPPLLLSCPKDLETNGDHLLGP